MLAQHSCELHECSVMPEAAATGAAPAAVPAAAAAADRGGFKPGSKVKLQNLKARPEINGCKAICESFTEENGRWTVKVDTGKGDCLETLALKPANLDPIKVEDERSVNVKADGKAFGFSALTLKLTLTEKQIKKPLAIAVVVPFLKAFAKKCGGRLFGPDDIEKITVDGTTLSDFSIASSVVLMKKKGESRTSCDIPHAAVGRLRPPPTSRSGTRSSACGPNCYRLCPCLTSADTTGRIACSLLWRLPVVELEIFFVPPPPPPPLLDKNVALTGLDTMAYKGEHNGKWAKVLDFDDTRGVYTVAVNGEKKTQLMVQPRHCIEIVRVIHHHNSSDFEDFGRESPFKKMPKPGTTAFDIWERGIPERARQAEDLRSSNLAKKAFSLVPFDEKVSHVDAQLEVLNRRVQVCRDILKHDINLYQSNEKLKTAYKDSEAAKKEILKLEE